jgi:hypothetical protein
VVRNPADRVRAEADEYRQGEARPLAGYTGMVVFGGLTGVVGAVMALTGTRVRRVSPYELFLVAVGTHKVSRLLAKDAVMSPLRAPFTRYKDSGGPSEVMEEVREDGDARHAIGELVTCPFCLSVWIASGFTVGLLFAPRFTQLVASMLTAVAGADFLQLAYAHLQQVAEH